MTDDQPLPMPATTREFATYLRTLADQVDRIPDTPINMHEDDVEVGFYYANPVFPQLPTGVHVQLTASTYRR